MSVLVFPTQYGRMTPDSQPGLFPGDPQQTRSGLRDLIGSDDRFLSMLEAMHYLSFPGC